MTYPASGSEVRSLGIDSEGEKVIRRFIEFGIVTAPSAALTLLPQTGWLDAGQAQWAVALAVLWFVGSLVGLVVLERHDTRPPTSTSAPPPLAPASAPIEPRLTTHHIKSLWTQAEAYARSVLAPDAQIEIRSLRVSPGL